jgi:exodeoxyribonuclease VII small subunit
LTRTAAAAEVTFEDGYAKLKDIVARLDADDVSVHEMCELFAQGKGLEKALRGYLTTQKGKLDSIEAGEDLPNFVIVAPGVAEADRPADSVTPSASDFTLPSFDGGFQAAAAPAARQTTVADDDIPF